jgi:hypothetical protein
MHCKHFLSSLVGLESKWNAIYLERPHEIHNKILNLIFYKKRWVGRFYFLFFYFFFKCLHLWWLIFSQYTLKVHWNSRINILIK